MMRTQGTITLVFRHFNNVSDQTSELVGSTEADIRARFGEPVSIVNTRWVYEALSGNPLYLFFGEGKVKIASPNDLPIDAVKKR